VPARSTNLALLGALALASATGVGAVWTGSPRGAWVVIGHGVAGVTVVLLIPWKSRVVRHGIRRKRWTRWFSYVLAVLALAVLASGLGYATGVVRSAGDRETLWWHVAFAFALVPVLLATHVGDRPLSAGHGFPLRLVAPGRRGYWWVKWVDRVELRETPWWWQPPFPVT
jgi:Oxidoreductase molybdopterin binding domain